MSRSRLFAAFLVLALLLAGVGCDGGGGEEGGTDSTAADELPSDFEVDTEATVELAVTADGGGVGVATGDAYAAVYVPPGAAEEGATWQVTPLAEAPEGVKYPLCPGVYVDTQGGDPTDWCSIGFSLPGEASPNATIVKLADDGTVAEVVATTRMDYGGRTFLTAYVQGFSPYTTSEEDQAARDAAWVEQAQMKGQTPDWTIKVIGSETQSVQGWEFIYDLDIFASGGGVGMGGPYKGTCLLSMTGKYSEDLGIVQSLGDISGGVRDESFEFSVVDFELVNLLTGESGGEPTICSSGYISGEGFGNLNISATAPDVQGEYHSGPVSGGEPVSFEMRITGEDVQVEIENVGIFPGKILRTAQ